VIAELAAEPRVQRQARAEVECGAPAGEALQAPGACGAREARQPGHCDPAPWQVKRPGLHCAVRCYAVWYCAVLSVLKSSALYLTVMYKYCTVLYSIYSTSLYRYC